MGTGTIYPVIHLENTSMSHQESENLVAQQWKAELRTHLPERNRIINKYLKGSGIEIGALFAPQEVPDGSQVQYVDRLPLDDLHIHYPEMRLENFVPVDVVDDGEILAKFEDSSCDFVIANHFLEHCQNPIFAIENNLRILRPGGISFWSIPDKRYSFDIDRPVTPYAHLLKDYIEGPDVSRRAHFEDWVEHVEKVTCYDAGEFVDRLMIMNYSIHYHVWTQTEIVELFCNMQKRISFEIEMISRNFNEVIVVLRKT